MYGLFYTQRVQDGGPWIENGKKLSVLMDSFCFTFGSGCSIRLMLRRADMLEENVEVQNAEEELECEENTDRAFFEGLIAFSRYMNLPDDYWDKEGIGWK